TQADSAAYVSVTVDYNGSATFKAFVKSSDGYEFKGWHEKADCSDTAVSTLNEYTLSGIQANKTLYAEFALKRYSVTAVAVTSNGSDGGTVAQIVNNAEAQSGTTININDVAHNSTVTLKAKPTDGATFDGWYDAETGGNRLDNPASETLTLTVTDKMNVYARFTVTKKTTTIYVAPRSGFGSYNLWVYDKADESKKHNGGTWPGGALELDSTTGYYKLTFTTSYSGNFYVILSNSGNNKVPDNNDKGFLDEYGKTYLIGDSTMTEYNPVSVTLNAVSVNASGVTQSNGFTGGSITVGGTQYTAAKTLSRNSGSSFSATATESGNYKFVGWYDNDACTGTPVSPNATLSVTLTENKIYYAKFVEQPNPNITITFIDNTTNYWASEQGKVYLKDNNTGTVYNSEEDRYSSNHQATFTVPSTVTDITFYRYQNGYGTSALWSTINAGSRGTKTKYAIVSEAWDKPISGSWQ
ncbi:MAG: InlB B-repeat-containing protein, partial [Ruminococcus sp.]|nr:InlB B-repeat-containing protein [Ruminococcus sp.]